MSNNSALNKAQSCKNDEFYTLYADIEKALSRFHGVFENRVVYCNCDNPATSMFYKYFRDNFTRFKLKELIATYYDCDNPVVGISYNGVEHAFTLTGNGDFRNEENIDILKHADIVVTNPPFSLITPYLLQLLTYNKKFIVVAPLYIASYRKLWAFVRNKDLKIGIYNDNAHFMSPFDNTIKKRVSVCWWHNFDIDLHLQSHSPINTPYIDGKYEKFVNYDIINVNSLREIPYDYTGIMGVPITALVRLDLSNIDLIGMSGFDYPCRPTTLTDVDVYRNENKIAHYNKLKCDILLNPKTKPTNKRYYMANGYDNYLVEPFRRVFIRHK